MSCPYSLRSGLSFLVGISLLLGTLLATVLLLLANLYLPVLLVVGVNYPLLLLLLLLLLIGGILLGIWLITRSNEPLWSKLLALFSPVLVPLVLFLLAVF